MHAKKKVDVGTTKPEAEKREVPKQEKPKATPKLPFVAITAIDPMAVEAANNYLRLCKMRPNSKRYIKKLEKDIAAIKAWQKANLSQVGYR